MYYIFLSYEKVACAIQKLYAITNFMIKIDVHYSRTKGNKISRVVFYKWMRCKLQRTWLLQMFSRFHGVGVLTKPLSLVTDRRSGTKLLQYLAPVRTAAHFTSPRHFTEKLQGGCVNSKEKLLCQMTGQCSSFLQCAGWYAVKVYQKWNGFCETRKTLSIWVKKWYVIKKRQHQSF